MPGVFLLDKLLLGAVFPTVHRRPPVNGDLLRLGDLQDMGVQLVGQDAHDAIGELPESHQSEKLAHAAWKEQPPDVPPQDDTIETTVFELDIRRELLHKGILHGQCPFYRAFLFYRVFLLRTSHIGLPVKNQSSAGGAGQEDRGAPGWQKKGMTFLNYIRDLPRLNLTIAPLSPCPVPLSEL